MSPCRYLSLLHAPPWLKHPPECQEPQDLSQAGLPASWPGAIAVGRKAGTNRTRTSFTNAMEEGGLSGAGAKHRDGETCTQFPALPQTS